MKPDEEAPPDVKARLPLRDAEVEITEKPGRPGAYDCILRLAPHYQLEGVVASVQLQTELRSTTATG